MDLVNQVISLELSKKLKGFGVKQESYFWWTIPEGGNEADYFISNEDAFGFCEQDTCSFNHGRVSAYTVAELGELLPYYFSSEKHSNDWRCGFSNNDVMKDVPFMSADTEANARAKMLVYLLENKLIEV